MAWGTYVQELGLELGFLAQDQLDSTLNLVPLFVFTSALD